MQQKLSNRGYNPINDDVDEISKTLKEQQLKYMENVPKKWFVFGFGIFVGIVMGSFLPFLYTKLTNASYNRAGLDGIMKNLLGEYHIKDVLSDEVLIVAYDYNSQEPRFFSKYFSEQDPLIYDVPVGNATGASSAAPTFFDPKVQKDGYDFIELQIDGGIICNNPSLYAYEISKDLNQKENIRLVSIGTGEKTFTKVDPESMNNMRFVSKMGEFMMNMDSYAAHKQLEAYMPNADTNYIRMQTTSNIGMDKVDKASIEGLKSDGQKLWDENEEKVTQILRDIIDEKFAPKPAPAK